MIFNPLWHCSGVGLQFLLLHSWSFCGYFEMSLKCLFRDYIWTMYMEWERKQDIHNLPNFMNWKPEKQSWGTARKHITLCSRLNSKITNGLMKRKAGLQKKVFSCLQILDCAKVFQMYVSFVECKAQNLSKALLKFCSQSQSSEREGTLKLGCWHQCQCSGTHSSSGRAIEAFPEVSCRKCQSDLIRKFSACWKAALTQKVRGTETFRQGSVCQNLLVTMVLLKGLPCCFYTSSF